MKDRRFVKKSEALAMLPDALQTGEVEGRKAMWWDFYVSIPSNERHGSVAVVTIRGSLDHHRGFGGDSYEGILDRVSDAISGRDVVKAAEQAAYWDESVEVPAATPPSCVVLRIDSPGGVCSGLNETVFALQRMSKKARIPLYAYVDELAASAAYALSCACEWIVLPESAICGSIGVISTMFDTVEFDKKMGVNFVTLTSGARKADGHPHVAVTEEAIAAEQARVDQLAQQFFSLVSESRKLSAKKVQGFQAGLFLGSEGVEAGVADDVMGWDDFINSLDDSEKSLATMGQVETPSNSTVGTRAQRGSTKGIAMPPRVALQALVKDTKAQLAAAKDAKAKKALTERLAKYEAALQATAEGESSKEKYKKTKTVETFESESEEEGAESESEEGEKSESEEESKSAKGNESDRKQEDPPSDDDGDEDEDAKAEASLQQLAQTVTGKRGQAAVGALASLVAQGQRALAKVEQIEKERVSEKKEAMITAALNAHKITRHEAKDLRGKPMSFVKPYLEMRPKAIINTDEEDIHQPSDSGKVGAGGVALNAETMKQIDLAVASLPEGTDRDAARAAMIDANVKRMNGTAPAGRY